MHALDATRGLILILGVVFHTVYIFLLPAGEVVADNVGNVPLSIIAFTLHVFRMTIFFVLAGFFARLSLGYRGVKHFVQDRLIRIALPLVTFWLIMITFDTVIAWWLHNPQLRSVGDMLPTLAIQSFPLFHLWFLYVLLILYSVAVVANYALAGKRGAAGAMLRLGGELTHIVISKPGGVVLLAAPLILVFLFWRWPIPWWGIPAPNGSLLVEPTTLVAYGTSFAFGYMLHREIGSLRVIASRSTKNALAALVFGAASLFLIGVVATHDPLPFGPRKILYAVCYGLTVWYSSLALIGLAVRFLSRKSGVLRYMADASYWIYLVHVPLIVLLQAIFAEVSMPWWLKVAMIIVATLGLSLLSYQLLVARSIIGGILNRGQFKGKALVNSRTV